MYELEGHGSNNAAPSAEHSELGYSGVRIIAAHFTKAASSSRCARYCFKLSGFLVPELIFFAISSVRFFIRLIATSFPSCVSKNISVPLSDSIDVELHVGL